MEFTGLRNFFYGKEGKIENIKAMDINWNKLSLHETYLTISDEKKRSAILKRNEVAQWITISVSSFFPLRYYTFIIT